MRTIRTPKTRARFLDALEQTGNVTKACRLIRVAKHSVYDWRDDDPDFKAAWEKALERASDLLEEEARRRAYKGVRKPVFQGWKLVGHIQEYSDTLLIFLLKGNKPKKFGDRTTFAGDVDNPVQVKLDGAELIAKILGPAKSPNEGL